MEVKKLSPGVLESAKLCAEQGWKGNFQFHSGETLEGAYITGTNWDLNVIRLERVGERDLPPRTVELVTLKSIDPLWN